MNSIFCIGYIKTLLFSPNPHDFLTGALKISWKAARLQKAFQNCSHWIETTPKAHREGLFFINWLQSPVCSWQNSVTLSIKATEIHCKTNSATLRVGVIQHERNCFYLGLQLGLIWQMSLYQGQG